MKKKVTFKSKGLNCSAILHLPDKTDGKKKLPAIILGNGIGGVKEMHLSDYSEYYNKAGIATLAFDYRYFGDSEGEPRQQCFPLEQVEDYRNAISYMQSLPEIDPDRIGIWGTSLSGGLVVYVASFDKRVKVVISQVPALFNPEWRSKSNPQRWKRESEIGFNDRIDHYKTGKVNFIKIMAEKEGDFAISPTPVRITSQFVNNSPNHRNELTVASLEKIDEFDPMIAVSLITAPIMFIAAMEDAITPDEIITMAYQKVSGPKSIVILPVNHFEVYNEQWLPRCADLQVEWCKKYL